MGTNLLGSRNKASQQRASLFMDQCPSQIQTLEVYFIHGSDSADRWQTIHLARASRTVTPVCQRQMA